MEELKIKDLVDKNFVRFNYYRQGFFYYELEQRYGTLQRHVERFLFPVPIEDIGTATLLAEDKAITYMRWIRKALEDKTLTKTI